MIMSEQAEKDEFGDAGWVDDDDLMLAANQVESVASFRASKRRRLNNSGAAEIITANKDNSMYINTVSQRETRIADSRDRAVRRR